MSVTLMSALLSPVSAEPSFGPATICRAAIASIAERDPNAVQATQTVGLPAGYRKDADRIRRNKIAPFVISIILHQNAL
jgi:hypothetical protein